VVSRQFDTIELTHHQRVSLLARKELAVQNHGCLDGPAASFWMIDIKLNRDLFLVLFGFFAIGLGLLAYINTRERTSANTQCHVGRGVPFFDGDGLGVSSQVECWPSALRLIIAEIVEL